MVGIDDEVLGQAVCAVLVVQDSDCDMDEVLKLPLSEKVFKQLNDVIFKVKEYVGEELPKYSLPRSYVVLKEISRNAMGKVNKRELVKQLLNKE